MIAKKLNSLIIELANYIKLKLFPYHKTPLVRGLLKFYYNSVTKFLPHFMPGLDNTAMIALTYRCQCRCVHCSAALYRDDAKTVLKPQEVIKLIDDCKNNGISEIYFFGGEPLLVPELDEFIRYAKKKRMITRMDTNGFLLSQSRVKQLKSAGLDVVGISLDSPNSAVHDKLRGLPGIFNKAVRAIELCRDCKIICYISTYATKNTLRNGELAETIKLAKRLKVMTRILSPIVSGRWLKKDAIILSQDEIKKLRTHLEKDTVFWEILPIDDKDTPFRCVAIENMYFYVSAYGEIQPCCFVPLSFGNIREEPLCDIVKRMRASDMFVKHQGCSDCPLNDRDFKAKYGVFFEANERLPKRVKT
ncbi:MAG: radical SAM protein [Candidatus Omnitrophota bacterium]